MHADVVPLPAVLKDPYGHALGSAAPPRQYEPPGHAWQGAPTAKRYVPGAQTGLDGVVDGVAPVERLAVRETGEAETRVAEAVSDCGETVLEKVGGGDFEEEAVCDDDDDAAEVTEGVVVVDAEDAVVEVPVLVPDVPCVGVVELDCATERGSSASTSSAAHTRRDSSLTAGVGGMAGRAVEMGRRVEEAS